MQNQTHRIATDLPALLGRILERLWQHGKPVKKTQTGFELDRGEFLCSLREMKELKSRGLVEQTTDSLYFLSEKGVEQIHLDTANQMRSRPEALMDPAFRAQMQALKDVTAALNGTNSSPVVFSTDPKLGCLNR